MRFDLLETKWPIDLSPKGAYIAHCTRGRDWFLKHLWARDVHTEYMDTKENRNRGEISKREREGGREGERQRERERGEKQRDTERGGEEERQRERGGGEREGESEKQKAGGRERVRER